MGRELSLIQAQLCLCRASNHGKKIVISHLASWKQRIGLVLFYSFVAAALLAPVAADSFIPAVADYINHLAGIIQAKIAFSEGQFPLRVAPFEQGSWRYPLFQFYSPSTYTIAGAIYTWLTPSNPLIAYKITIWCALMLGGLYMNRLAYWFTKSHPAAILASIVYLVSPYYIVVVNHFSDLSEMIALGVLPAAIFYTLERYAHPNNKTLLQMGLVWYLLITTHIVTFVYTSLFIAIFLLLITFRNKRHWLKLLHVGVGYAFALLLAMWYLAPIGLLGKYIIIAQTYATTKEFATFNPVISQLLFPGSAEFKKNLIENHPAIGWFILSAFGICSYVYLNRLKINNKRANYFLPTLLILFFIAFILTWSPFNFWKFLPGILLVGQYSWRLLGQLIWIGALLFSFAICWLFKDKLDERHTIIGILFVVMAANASFPTLNRSNIDIAKFSAHPNFVYNTNAYTINYNKYTHFVDKIDSMVLYLLMKNNQLQLNTAYIIPQTLLQYAKNPVISLTGSIAKRAEQTQLIALVNDKKIAILNLKQGPLHWNIELKPVLDQFKKASKISLQFKMLPEKKLNISIEKILLSGFFDPKDTLMVKEVEPHCELKGPDKICKIAVPTRTRFMELPILYYPTLLEIKLNGKSIAYQSVIYLDHLIVGIIPEPGKENTVQIHFRGINWANKVSLISWCVGMILLFGVFFTWLKCRKS